MCQEELAAAPGISYICKRQPAGGRREGASWLTERGARQAQPARRAGNASRQPASRLEAGAGPGLGAVHCALALVVAGCAAVANCSSLEAHLR
jgi:hypothetical protein